jgi:hypothetical protein
MKLSNILAERKRYGSSRCVNEMRDGAVCDACGRWYDGEGVTIDEDVIVCVECANEGIEIDVEPRACSQCGETKPGKTEWANGVWLCHECHAEVVACEMSGVLIES